jgi:hypothetical protein
MRRRSDGPNTDKLKEKVTSHVTRRVVHAARACLSFTSTRCCQSLHVHVTHVDSTAVVSLRACAHLARSLQMEDHLA